MKRNYIESGNLPKGFPITEYERVSELFADLGVPLDKAVAAAVDSNPGSQRIVDVANNYMHQKDGLVEGRDNLTTHIEHVLKFPRLYKEVKRKTADGEKTIKVPADAHKTDNLFAEAFVSAVVAKKFTVPGLQLTGTNDEQNEGIVWNFLQAAVEKPWKGNVTFVGDEKATEVTLFDLKNDIKAPERKTAEKSLPEYAVNGAANIIKNNRQAHWAKTFTEKGIAFDDFLQKAPAGATPEQVAAVEKSNLVNLAKAIQANEKADQAKKYA